MAKIFEDIKVLDVGSYVASPAAATILADFGASVIKIEPRASFEQAGAPYPAPQRWKDIWSAGHSVSGVTSIQSVVQLIESTRQEYHAAMRRSLGQIEATGAQSPAAPLAEVDCLRGEKI